MLFIHGNKEWLKREKNGRDPLFKTASELAAAFIKYQKWNEKKVWKKKKWVGKDAKLVHETIVPPMTLTGMCGFFGATTSWWHEFKKRKKSKKEADFLYVIQAIEEAMYTQKFEGAAVNAYNANIISRELGLVDKQEVKSETTDKTPDRKIEIVIVQPKP